MVKITVKELALFSVLGALTFAAKYVMAVLPNIEPVSLLTMLFAVTFGWKSLYCVYTFVAMEILFHGIGLWNINYLYIWTVLAVAAIALRKMEPVLGWALLSGVFGLAFGWLYRKFGLRYAMIAHGGCHVVSKLIWILFV